MNSSQKYKLIAAGMIANLLEWYDSGIYGYFAVAIGRETLLALGPGRPTSFRVRRIRRRLFDEAAGGRARPPYRRLFILRMPENELETICPESSAAVAVIKGGHASDTTS
jgi:hypothetical protein